MRYTLVTVEPLEGAPHVRGGLLSGPGIGLRGRSRERQLEPSFLRDTGRTAPWSWDLESRRTFKLLTPIIVRIGKRQEETIWGILKQYLEAFGGGHRVGAMPSRL